MANIGFIGLGDMGQVIIPRLIESGHKVVGWNRTPGKSDNLESIGMGLARTPAAEACEGAQLVLSLLVMQSKLLRQEMTAS